MKISDRIEVATNANVKSEKFASENYQIMNYGLAGKITPHMDTVGVKFDRDYTDAKNRK